jgi:tRNA threonylcarbamoyl adenosine modification protein YeaZ
VTDSSDGRRRWILGIDTATSRVVVAAAEPDGAFLGATTWEAGHRHGERLLPSIGRLTGELNLRRSRIAAVAAGTGPGAFTGLRVGLATAKAIAHELGVPIAGVPTGEALIDAAAAADEGAAIDPQCVVLLLPAGPSDRVVVRHGAAPELLRGGSEPSVGAGDIVVAVDLDGRAPAEASARGLRALDGLPRSLVRIAGARLAAGQADDLDRLVPEYVTLPRGVTATTGEVAWSHGPR